MPPRAAAPRRSDHARRRHVLEATRRALAFVVLAACAGLGGAVGPVSLGHGMPIDVRMLEVMRFDPDFFSSARDPDVQLACIGSNCGTARVLALLCSNPSTNPAHISSRSQVRARIDGCAGDACGVWMCEPEALEEGWRLSGVRLTCEQAYGPPGEMEKAFMVKRGSCVARYGLVESASGEGGDVQGWAAGEATKEEEVPPAREAPNAGASSAPPSSEHSGTFQNILEGAGGAGTRGSLDKGGGAVGEVRGFWWWVTAVGFDGALVVVAMVVATLASLRSRYRKHMGMRLVTPEERKDIHRQFVEIDADGSGALDRDELRAALQKLGFRSISQRAFEDLFAEADLDGNGSIDEEEFVTLLMRHKLDGQLSFAECASQVLSRDFGHLRRNWKDEVGQQLGLGAIMVLFLVVIYSLARLASSLQEKAGRDL